MFSKKNRLCPLMMPADDFEDRKLQTFGIDPLDIVNNDSFCATGLQMYLNLVTLSVVT